MSKESKKPKKAKVVESPPKQRPTQQPKEPIKIDVEAEPRRLPAVGELSYKHKQTLRAIFQKPPRGDIRWSDIEALIVAPGGQVSEGSGSRVRSFLVRPAVFHEPHPSPMTDKGAVKSVQNYLSSIGVKP